MLRLRQVVLAWHQRVAAMALRGWAASSAAREARVEALRGSVMAMRQRAVWLCFSRLREAGRGRA
eukprot:5034975-Prymnesium_polylepis.1